MIPDREPLARLASTTDPAEAARCIEELRAAGFADPERIAHDFGWRWEA